MPAPLTVECPSGLVVSVREYKVTDENFLANPDALRRGTNESDLLTAITQRVENIGPYEKSYSGGSLNWLKVLKGDQEFVLRDNRVATWGEEFNPHVQCPRCENVAERNLFDLTTLPTKKLPEVSLPHVRDGVPLKVTLPRAGNTVTFKLLRGEDDKALSRLRHEKKDKRSSGIFRYRTVEISGVEPTRYESWLEDLGGYDSSFLRAAYEEADCGIDHGNCQFVCEHCHYAWTDDVEFGKGFLFPKFRGKTSIGT